jgi:hypothetical protein
MYSKQLKIIFVRATYIMAILAVALSVTGRASAQEPVPWFTAFPAQEAVEGWDWPLGVTLHLTIDDPNTGTLPDHEQDETVILAPWGSGQHWVWFDFVGVYDMKPGDEVTLDDGVTTRTHTVQNLTVSDVDATADTVAGTADPGAMVNVWPHEAGENAQHVTVAEDGTWSASFAGVFDLAAGTAGRSEIVGVEGNATAVDWWIPNPHFTIFPEWEWFDGYDWPDGATVTITVEGKPECETAKESSGNFFNGGFPEGCDVQIGDVVTFTDGETIRTHTVQNLAITKVNQEDDTIKGVASAGAEVYVWPHATGEQQMVTANPKGKWNVDFTGVYDLMRGDGGRAEVRDETGNATAVDWYIPNPRIVASITEDWFYLQEFSPNTTLKFTVYEAQGEKPIWKGTATTDNSGFAWIDADGRWNFEPGNYLIVKDGQNTKDLVIEGFTFDVFNLSNGQLTGTAPEPYGRRVWVGIGWENDGWSMDVATNDTGAWFADFQKPVPSDYWWVAAQIFDSDGDASELRPSPRSLMIGNFSIAWSQANPEEVIYLSWMGSGNLTNTWVHPNCSGDLEFFGNSWVTETDYFWASLVGWGTTGTWENPVGGEINIASSSSGCAGSTDIPINTQYQFFEDKPDLIMIQRTFEFGDTPYAHDVRPFIPRLYPSDGFTQVLHPNANGDDLVTDTTCDFGCTAESWDGSWFAIHNPITGLGMIVLSEPSAYSIALWLDDDDGSFTNASSVLLLQPAGGFVGTVTETEYLCFYNTSWTPSLTLPEGCQP